MPSSRPSRPPAPSPLLPGDHAIVFIEKLGVSSRTSSFVLPIGATVNMDGTSMYQAIAVVALAQFHMVESRLVPASRDRAHCHAWHPSVPPRCHLRDLVLMIIVLESVGLNPAWIALIFPVDRILDMCRTVVNVTGDGAVSSMIAASENELHPDAATRRNCILMRFPRNRLTQLNNGCLACLKHSFFRLIREHAPAFSACVWPVFCHLIRRGYQAQETEFAEDDDCHLPINIEFERWKSCLKREGTAPSTNERRTRLTVPSRGV